MMNYMDDILTGSQTINEMFEKIASSVKCTSRRESNVKHTKK